MNLINLQAHQQRVVEEYIQLGERLRLLCEFIGSHRFNQVESPERELLLAQKTHMDAYFVTLKQRIDSWPRPEPAPVDRAQVQLTDGSPVTQDHREINPATGQQKGYVVLSDEERAKGFVRPLRNSYVHNKCGRVTTMHRSIAETYARDPKFYSGTFCVGCTVHVPLSECTWYGTDEVVGS